MQRVEIVTLRPEHQSQFLRFSDKAIGKGYFTPHDFAEILELSTTENGSSTSFVLAGIEGNEIYGLRLTYPPGRWLAKMGKECCLIDKWQVPPETVGYFKSLFIAEDLRGQGWGPKLSQCSLEVLAKLGCRAIITHSWKESPNNSSQRYLEHFGFKKIGEHRRFWGHIDYECTRCGSPPCQCTAVEMIYYLNEKGAPR